ncbi:transporter substrate-binding domain-containing protein [Labrenzia sp. PHM005]|nr:transporter substrate-binding domain-containing protein [Labrenzia sp. PHM005]
MFLIQVRFWIVVLTALCSPISVSADTVTLYTAELPGLHQSDGSGKYDVFLNKAAAVAGVDLKIIYWPVARAITAFQNCENCCANPCTQAPGIDYCEGANLSKPLSVSRLYVFTGSSKDPISDLATLKGKTVGKLQGMQIGEAVPAAGSNLIEIADIASALQMLDLGRLDAFAAWTPDIFNYLSQNNLPPLSYVAEAPVLTVSEHLGCKGLTGQKLIDAANALRFRLLN